MKYELTVPYNKILECWWQMIDVSDDCSDVGEKCWWKKVCWWRISVMLVKGMLVKKSIFMYVGEACWWRKLCMLVKNFSNVGEIVMLVKNLLLRCWRITEKHFHVCWWMMLVKMGMLVKKVCRWRKEFSCMLVKPTYHFTNIPSPTYSFHQHKISQIFSPTSVP